MLDAWQEMILQDAMGERADQTWAAKRVGISVPRQNGKSQLLVSRALAGALLFGERKIVISAHQQDTARESFGKLMELIEADENQWIRDRIRPNGIMQALNREAVRFNNGATIQFKARSGSGSRGFSSDCLMLDEAQILSQRAWVSINSTMSAMPNPQIWLLGTPPTPEDDGAVFESIRDAAKTGKSNTTAWLEWAADPAADPALDETRWSANPAWNSRINHEVVQGEYETYPRERFALDRLGIWFSDIGGTSIFPNWGALGGKTAPQTVAIGIAISIDREWASIGAACGPEGSHLAANQRAQMGPWLLAEATRIGLEHGIPVAVDERGPAASLIEPLREAGVWVHAVGTSDYLDACEDLFDAVRDGQIEHGSYDELDDAVRAASWRKVGDRNAWARRNGDISMLEAVTLARHAALNGATATVW